MSIVNSRCLLDDSRGARWCSAAVDYVRLAQAVEARPDAEAEVASEHARAGEEHGPGDTSAATETHHHADRSPRF